MSRDDESRRSSHRRSCALRFYPIWALLALATVAGCTRTHIRRLEQIALAGDRIQAIVSEGTLTHVVDAGTYYTGVKYYLLEYPATAGLPPCPPVRPTRVLDAGLGLDTTRQPAAQRVDFLMGAHPGRVVRVVRRMTPTRVTQRFDVLGPDPSTGRWRVLAGWTVDDPGGRPSIVGTPGGGRLVFANPPRVLDTRTMSEERRPDVERMLRVASDAARDRPSDFLFTDDLAYLRVGKLPQAPGKPADDWNVMRSWYVDRETAQLHPIWEKDMVVPDGEATPRIVQWEDWNQRTEESFFGLAGEVSPVGGFRLGDPRWTALLRDTAWDVAGHRAVIYPSRRCGGIALLIYAADRPPEFRYIDVDVPLAVSR